MLTEKLNKILLYIIKLRKIDDLYELSIKNRLEKSLNTYNKELQSAATSIYNYDSNIVLKDLGDKNEERCY